MRRTTSQNVECCRMTSEFYVCNVETWKNDTSKFQMLIVSLFVIESVKCWYGFSWFDHKEHFDTKII